MRYLKTAALLILLAMAGCTAAQRRETLDAALHGTKVAKDVVRAASAANDALSGPPTTAK